MEIRKSTLEDLPVMLSIYEDARVFMAETGNPNQWGPTNWPPTPLLEEDIEIGRSYVCVDDGEIIGTFVYIYGKDIDRTYDVIRDGAWSKDAPYGVVHRLASIRRGTGAFCLEWALKRSGYMRIDTHPDNAPMIHLLKKMGFKKSGIIHVVEDNYPRYAFEGGL